MPALTLSLPTHLALALRKFAIEHEQSQEDIVILALREFLTMMGYIEVGEMDEDTETEGNA